MSREYAARFQCGYPECREIGNYIAHTRKEQTALYNKYANGKWRCVRHSQPSEVLSISEPIKEKELILKRVISDGNDIGLFWDGHWGFEHGHGFKAFAKDFPEGTKLLITAKIILP